MYLKKLVKYLPETVMRDVLTLKTAFEGAKLFMLALLDSIALEILLRAQVSLNTKPVFDWDKNWVIVIRAFMVVELLRLFFRFLIKIVYMKTLYEKLLDPVWSRVWIRE